MHKKYFHIILIVLIFICTLGCNSQIPIDETHNTSTETTLSPIPGISNADTPIQNPLDDETNPTDASNNPTVPSEAPTEPTDTPTDTSEPTTESTDPSEDATEPSEEVTTPEETSPSTTPENTTASYEAYIAMSAEEQVAFYNTFDSMEAFVAWYNAAKAEYDAAHPDIDIGDGNIDLGDLVGGGK